FVTTARLGSSTGVFSAATGATAIQGLPLHVALPISEQWGVLPATTYARGTHGIVYQQIVIDLPPLDDELLALLPYYTSALTEIGDRKSTRLNSSHVKISYAVFCLQKKKKRRRRGQFA